MPWTSSWGSNAPWSAPVLETLGRAVFAAQAFEERCRYLLRLMNLIQASEDKIDDPLESLIARIPADKMLDGTIVEFKKLQAFSPDVLVVLQTAKDARNFISHESGHFFPCGPIRDTVQKINGVLRPKLRELAAGDHWASKLELVFEDNEAAYGISWLDQTYPDILESWVLFPMKDLLAAEGAVPLRFPDKDPWYAARHASDVALAEKFRTEHPQK